MNFSALPDLLQPLPQVKPEHAVHQDVGHAFIPQAPLMLKSYGQEFAASNDLSAFGMVTAGLDAFGPVPQLDSELSDDSLDLSRCGRGWGPVPIHKSSHLTLPDKAATSVNLRPPMEACSAVAPWMLGIQTRVAACLTCALMPVQGHAALTDPDGPAAYCCFASLASIVSAACPDAAGPSVGAPDRAPASCHAAAAGSISASGCQSTQEA